NCHLPIKPVKFLQMLARPTLAPASRKRMEKCSPKRAPRTGARRFTSDRHPKRNAGCRRLAWLTACAGYPTPRASRLLGRKRVFVFLRLGSPDGDRNATRNERPLLIHRGQGLL